MRTQGAFYADTPHGGGLIFANPSKLGLVGSFALARAAGPPILWSAGLTASQSGQACFGLDGLRRLLEFPGNYPKTDAGGIAVQPHQERFGKAAGTPGWVEAAPGFPPYTGATQLTPPTADPSKGIKILDVFVSYGIGTTDAGSATVGVYRNVMADNAAIAQTTLLAAAALTLTQRANPYLIKTALTTSIFEITDLSDIFAEVVVTAGGSSGTFTLYGIGFHCQFNYN